MALAFGLAALVAFIALLALIVVAVGLNAIEDVSDEEAHGDWPHVPEEGRR